MKKENIPELDVADAYQNDCTESLYSWFTGEFSTDHISIKTGNWPIYLICQLPYTHYIFLSKNVMGTFHRRKF